MTNNISDTLATSPAKASPCPDTKTLGAKVKSHRLHPFCGEIPAHTRVRLAPPWPCSWALLSPHGWDGLELSPSSCHLGGHFIPDAILSHSRDIQATPASGKSPLDTNPLYLAVFWDRNAESHPKPRGGTAGVTPRGCLVMGSLCQALPCLPTTEPSCLRKVLGYF